MLLVVIDRDEEVKIICCRRAGCSSICHGISPYEKTQYNWYRSAEQLVNHFQLSLEQQTHHY
jgi:hypothetical protein